MTPKPELARLNYIGLGAIVLTVGAVFLLGEKIQYFAIVIAGLLLISLLIRSVEWLIFATYLGSVGVFKNPDGLSIVEIGFYLLLLALIVFEIVPAIAGGAYHIQTALDRYYIGSVLVIVAGICVGILVNRNPFLTISEVVFFFSPLLFYLPLRRILNSGKRTSVLLILFGIIILLLSVRNVVTYRERVLEAVMEWELKSARSASNEINFVFGTIVAAAFLFFSQRRREMIGAASFLVISIIGLILTMSRGFWAAAVLGLGVMWLIVPVAEKKRMFMRASLAASLLIVTLLAVAPQYVTLASDLIVNRVVSSVGTSKMDPSIEERIIEYKQIFGELLDSPVLGYGAGTRYERYYLGPNTYRTTNFFHNAYLGIYFKYGLAGFIVFTGWLFSLMRTAFHRSKTAAEATRPLYQAIVASVFAMSIVNLTSPQWQAFDGNLFLVFCTVIVLAPEPERLLRRDSSTATSSTSC
jgi:O-antigen ligase